MTDAQLLNSTSPQGTWTVTQDSGTAGNQWGTVTWNTEPQGSEPAGTSITVEARAADTEAGLGAQAFVPVSNGVEFTLTGRFVQVRATRKRRPTGPARSSPTSASRAATATRTGSRTTRTIAPTPRTHTRPGR